MSIPRRASSTAATGAGAGKVWTRLRERTGRATKVDLLLLGDGYAEADLPKFHADVKRLVDQLFATEPFKSAEDGLQRAGDRSAVAAKRRQPAAHARTSGARRSASRTTSSTRSATCSRSTTARCATSRPSAPYDFLEILINEQQYGGGGIFNDHATAAVDTAFADYIFVHEFGHHFAGLADEYYTSDVAYETGAADTARAVGAERHRAAGPGEAEVERPRRSRTRRFRRRGTRTPYEKKSARDPGAAPGPAREERPGERDERALHRGAELVHAVPRRR